MKWNQSFPPFSQVTCLLKNIIVVRHLLRLQGIGKSMYIVDFPRDQILGNEIQWDILVPRRRNLLLHMKCFVTIFDQRKAVIPVKDDRIVDRCGADGLAIAINQSPLRLGINRVLASNTTRIYRGQKRADRNGPNPKYRFRPEQCASLPNKGRISTMESIFQLPRQGQSQPRPWYQTGDGGSKTA